MAFRFKVGFVDPPANNAKEEREYDNFLPHNKTNLR